MTLDRKNALVTGAGGGIGQATAIELAKAGGDIAVADIDAKSANDTSSRIEAFGRLSLLQVHEKGLISTRSTSATSYR